LLFIFQNKPTKS